MALIRRGDHWSKDAGSKRSWLWGEPTLEELLSDAPLEILMRRDGVSVSDFDACRESARRRIAAPLP